ncbi:unnamed protein product [Amoebophrya sp. A120]|nr:unnamed protein product [Amoebophrya sp. A120]|eukprot:GSA120T00008426001.1
MFPFAVSKIGSAEADAGSTEDFIFEHTITCALPGGGESAGAQLIPGGTASSPGTTFANPSTFNDEEGFWTNVKHCVPVPDYCPKNVELHDENKRPMKILKSGSISDDLFASDVQCLNPAYTKLKESRGSIWRGQSLSLHKKAAVCLADKQKIGKWEIYGKCEKAENFCFSSEETDKHLTCEKLPALQFEQSASVTICAKGYLEESVLDWEVKLTCSEQAKGASSPSPTSSQTQDDDDDISNRGQYRVTGVHSERKHISDGSILDGSKLKCFASKTYCPDFKHVPVVPRRKGLPKEMEFPRLLNSRFPIKELCAIGYEPANPEEDYLVCTEDRYAQGKWLVSNSLELTSKQKKAKQDQYNCEAIQDWCPEVLDVEKNTISSSKIAATAQITCQPGFTTSFLFQNSKLRCMEKRKWGYLKIVDPSKYQQSTSMAGTTRGMNNIFGDFDLFGFGGTTANGQRAGGATAVTIDDEKIRDDRLPPGVKMMYFEGVQAHQNNPSSTDSMGPQAAVVLTDATPGSTPGEDREDDLLCEKKEDYCKAVQEQSFSIEPGLINEVKSVVCADGYEPFAAVKIVPGSMEQVEDTGVPNINSQIGQEEDDAEVSSPVIITAKPKEHQVRCAPSAKDPQNLGEYFGTDLKKACVPKKNYCPDLSKIVDPTTGEKTLLTPLQNSQINEEKKVSCAVGYGCAECNMKRQFLLKCVSSISNVISSSNAASSGTTDVITGQWQLAEKSMRGNKPIFENRNPCKPIVSYCPKDPQLAPFGGPVTKEIEIFDLKKQLGENFCKNDEDIGFRLNPNEAPIRAELSGPLGGRSTTGLTTSIDESNSALPAPPAPYILQCKPKSDQVGEWRVRVTAFPSIPPIALSDFKLCLPASCGANVVTYSGFGPTKEETGTKKFPKGSVEKIQCPVGFSLKKDLESLIEQIFPATTTGEKNSKTDNNKNKLQATLNRDTNTVELRCSQHIEKPTEDFLSSALDPDFYCEPKSCQAGKITNGEILDTHIFGERVFPKCDLGFAGKPCMCAANGEFVYLPATTNEKNNDKFGGEFEEEEEERNRPWNFFGGFGSGGKTVDTTAVLQQADTAGTSLEPCACKLSKSFCNERSVPDLPLQGRRLTGLGDQPDVAPGLQKQNQRQAAVQEPRGLRLRRRLFGDEEQGNQIVAGAGGDRKIYGSFRPSIDAALAETRYYHCPDNMVLPNNQHFVEVKCIEPTESTSKSKKDQHKRVQSTSSPIGQYVLSTTNEKFDLKNYQCSAQRCPESLEQLKKVGYEILDTKDNTCSDSVGGICQLRCEGADEAWEVFTCSDSGENVSDQSHVGGGSAGQQGAASTSKNKYSWVSKDTKVKYKIDLNRCQSPITLMLQDAMTKEPVTFSQIDSIEIENELYGNRNLQINTKQLAKKNRAVFTWQQGDVGQLVLSPKQTAEAQTGIQFKQASQQYGEQFIAKDLANPNRKMLLFLLDRVMDHGDVNEDCTFAGEISSFRAVLWWDQYPKDLDLYATYMECIDQVYDLETAIADSHEFLSFGETKSTSKGGQSNGDGQVHINYPRITDDAIEADSGTAGKTTDLWIWSVNPTPSYAISYQMGLVVGKSGKPVYSRATGTGHPREFATDEFDELKKWYKKYPDVEKLPSFYLPFAKGSSGGINSGAAAGGAATAGDDEGGVSSGSESDSSPGAPGAGGAGTTSSQNTVMKKQDLAARKHRAAFGNPMTFFADKKFEKFKHYATLDIREAGYDVCPIVSCASKLQELRSSNKKVAMFDKKNCVPTINQRSKWVSWISPLLMHLETTYDRKLSGGGAAKLPAVVQSSSSADTEKFFTTRLQKSLQVEQEKKRLLVEKGQLNKKTYEKFLKSMSMWKAKGNSRLELEVDHRDGFGPETITMTNVPPGLYKFGVHAFTEDMYLRDATPTVKFWFGDTVLIHCKLDRDSCDDPQYSDVRWWSVATVLVEELPTKTTDPVSKQQKQNYRVKLLQNEAQQKKKLQYRDLPTREDVSPDFARGSSRRRYYKRVKLLYEDDSEQESKSNNWTLQKKTCSSHCWVEKGVADKCLG